MPTAPPWTVERLEEPTNALYCGESLLKILQYSAWESRRPSDVQVNNRGSCIDAPLGLKGQLLAVMVCKGLLGVTSARKCRSYENFIHDDTLRSKS
jgi:hypothetical protein